MLNRPTKGESGERVQIRISLTPESYAALNALQRRRPGVPAHRLLNEGLLLLNNSTNPETPREDRS